MHAYRNAGSDALLKHGRGEGGRQTRSNPAAKLYTLDDVRLDRSPQCVVYHEVLLREGHLLVLNIVE